VKVRRIVVQFFRVLTPGEQACFLSMTIVQVARAGLIVQFHNLCGAVTDFGIATLPGWYRLMKVRTVSTLTEISPSRRCCRGGASPAR